VSDIHDQLPHYDRVLFRKAPLELCLAQVRFPPLARFVHSEYIDAFREAVEDDYPVFARGQAMSVTLGPQGITSAGAGEVLRFTSIDSQWSIALMSESVALEARQYSTIDEFSERFVSILQRLSDHLRPGIQTRFGLRYVNEIRLHPEGDTYDGWRKLLNPELLGIGANNILGGTVEQTVGEIRTRRDNGVVLLRHGFLDGTTVASLGRAQPKTGPFYLIDIDHYDETTTRFSLDLEERLMAYHDFIYRVFSWCVGRDTLHNMLQGKG